MGTLKYDDVSIYYDKARDRYSAKVTLEKGAPRKNVYGKTEKEVLLKARELLYSARKEKFIISKGMPLLELVKMNVERKDDAGKIGDAQFNRTKYVINQIENSKIKNINVVDLTEKDLQDFFNEMAKNYADSSIEKCYSEIAQALNYAKRKEIIKENILEDIIKPKSYLPEREIIPLTVNEQKILSDYLFNTSFEKYKYKNVSLIQMYMGLRVGEALALKTTDIDLKNKRIHIQRSLTENREGKRVIGETPKTNAGNRVIPIPDIVYPYVKEQIEIGKNNFENLLFTNKGKIVSHTSVNSQLQRRLLRLGIYKNGMSTHSLRHTYATRCIESGMPAIVLCKLMGHSDVRITLNTYVKVFNEFQTKLSKEVEEYYDMLDFFNKNNNEKSNVSGKIIQFPQINRNEGYYR